MTTKYMHTIHGEPAQYEAGCQICYGGNLIRLVDSYAQIRSERRKTISWRKARGWAWSKSKYGHIRVVV